MTNVQNLTDHTISGLVSSYFPGAFPLVRLRRTRQDARMRALVRETRLHIDQLIYPIFVVDGVSHPQAIASMPGIMQWPVEEVAREAERTAQLGIKVIMLLGASSEKDEIGSQAFACDGVMQKAIRTLKAEIPDLCIIANICPCTFTSHGYCGIVKDGIVQNDDTLQLLAQAAISVAEAGADIIAPSDMMDGRVGAIRQVLDQYGHANTPIMSYSAKFASCLYGPYHEAMKSTSSPLAQDAHVGNISVGHQLDPANAREAMREVEQDINEGADMVIIKPALLYLDVIRRVRERFDVPIVAYNIGGEYSMLKLAAQQGWVDERLIVEESLTAILRAGADMIITYWALQVADWLA